MERQRAMPSMLSSSRPAEGWHEAFAICCGGLGPGGEGRAHRICDLVSAESLSGRLRGLLRDRRYQDELEPRKKGAAEVAAIAATIGRPECATGRQQRSHQPPSAATAPTPQCIEQVRRVRSVKEV